MLAIRLMRMGKKHQPFYRIVVMEKTRPRTSRTVEEIGYYNPLPEEPVIKIKLDRYEYWVSKGAQPTETVVSLVKRAKKLAQNENNN